MWRTGQRCQAENESLDSRLRSPPASFLFFTVLFSSRERNFTHTPWRFGGWGGSRIRHESSNIHRWHRWMRITCIKLPRLPNLTQVWTAIGSERICQYGVMCLQTAVLYAPQGFEKVPKCIACRAISDAQSVSRQEKELKSSSPFMNRLPASQDPSTFSPFRKVLMVNTVSLD